MWLLALLTSFSAAHVLAQEATSNPDWLSYLLQGGPFAVVVLLIILDKLTTTGERDRLRIENVTLREEIKLLNESIRKEIVPPLVQLNQLMRDVIAELSDREPPPPGTTTRRR